jgi:regulator of sigma E protease
MSVGLLILGLALFVLLIIVHEMGHFIVARRNGVEAEEFGIFFPPKIWSRKVKGKKGKKGFLFSINVLPLGGFVKLKGEHDADTGKGTYGAAKLSIKVKILVAGVAMNLLVAFILLTALAWLGMPKLVDNQFTIKSDTHIVKNETLVGNVQPGSPAAKAGLQTGDKLTAIGLVGQQPTAVVSAYKLPTVTKEYAGKQVELLYVRNDKPAKATITLLSPQTVAKSDKSSNPKGYLGVSPTQYTLQRSFWSAPVVAIGLIGQFTALTFHGLGTAIMGLVHGNTAQAESQVSGPVGIFEILKDGTLLGYQFVLMIIAIISLSLAIMNILPIPALDGGKLFVTLLARALHKRLTEAVENWVYGTGFVLLMTLIVLITIADVRRYF